MNVTLQPTKFRAQQRLNSYPAHSIPVKKEVSTGTQLPKDDIIGRSMVSFKGNVVDVKAMQKAKEDLIRRRDAAQAKLDKADAWDPEVEMQKAKDRAEAEIKVKNLSWYQWGKKSDIRDKHMNAFWEKHYEMVGIELSREDIEQTIKDLNDAIDGKNSEIKTGELLNEADNAQDAIDAMLNSKGGLNERIAGYGTEKSKIKTLLLDPIQKAKLNPDVKVPPAIMLYGATGTGKTTFLDAIEEQSNGGIVIDNMSAELDSLTLAKDFDKRLTSARNKYLEKGNDNQPKKTRTMLLINEAEKILSMTPAYAREHLDYALTDSDYALLETYNGNTDLNANVNHFKGYFDHCSQAPKDANDNERGALTVFITTNYPHLIHPDLLTRDGKLTHIAINPASGSNIEAVIKHYVTLSSNSLEAIKQIKDDKAIDMLSGISDSAKEKLKEYKNKGKLDELNIDVEGVPYDKIALSCKPTDKKGAYSNDRYRKICEDAFSSYLEKPETSYSVHLGKVLIREQRDIQPTRYAEFKRIHRILAPLEIGEREELTKLEKMGMLDEKFKGRLDYIRMIEQSDKDNLLAKQQLGQLTDEDKKRLDEINENQRLDALSFEEYFATPDEDDDD